LGRPVGTNYQWHNVGLYLAIAGSVLCAYALKLFLNVGHYRRPASHFPTFVAGTALACIAITVLFPHQSGLQKIYFGCIALGFGLLLIPLSRNGDAAEPPPPLSESLERLWANRSLLRIWVHYNVESRYTQTILGILWIVLLPLSTALVMTVVFSQLLRIQTGNVPFIAFFLAGYVPFGLFSQSISAGMKSILSAMQLINQIYFPREIIVLSALGEALADTFFMFLAMFVINLAVGIYPNALFLFLPVLALIEIALCLGLMFVVSWVSVLVRDVPQLVSVLLQIIFYLCPIIYPVQIVPQQYRFLINLNPLALLIGAYRDIIVYHRSPDVFSLIYPSALALAVLVFGYRHFKINEDQFADML
jgi:lipopolysaccharide transport system permease protein